MKQGEGVAGKLLSDERLGQKVSESVESISSFADRLTGLQAEVGIRSEYLFNQGTSKNTLSLRLIVQGMLAVPVAGSVTLFMAGTLLYMFAIASLGIFLATIARSMPQFGLLVIPVFLVLNMLSGGTTPLDSMPGWLQHALQLSPATHFVSLSMAIL